MLNSNSITIAIDCLGGDNYPDAQIGGISFFLKKNKEKNIKFLLFGYKEDLLKKLDYYDISKNNYEIINTEKKISSDEKPSIALRKGKDSSMWLAIESVKHGNADASISAGNTGALMAISKLILRPLADVDRPALVQMMPAENGSNVAMLDMGANIDCSSENLYQFALMGSVFFSAMTGKEEPIVGLLNVGSEDMKGNDVVKHTAVMLKDSILSENFFGFIEGNDIFRSVVDVVVTDGFTGNVTLKTIEGTVKFLTKNLREAFMGSMLSKLATILLSGSMRKFKKNISPENYNGAMFVGLNGISVKSHGNADGKSFHSAIESTVKLVESDINNKIMNLLSNIEV